MNFAVEVSFMINFVLIKTFDKDSCLCDSYKMLISPLEGEHAFEYK